MEWLGFILTAIGGSLTGAIGSILYLRPKLKEAMAGANKAETEATDAKVKHLVERVEAAERLYAQQGQALDDVRKEVLKLTKDVQQRDIRIIQLETENKLLSDKITELSNRMLIGNKRRGPYAKKA